MFQMNKPKDYRVKANTLLKASKINNIVQFQREIYLNNFLFNIFIVAF